MYQNHYGLDAVQFSIFFAMNALGFFGASQFAGPLGERFGPARVMHMAIIGFVVFAALLFAVAALTDIHLYVLVAMLFPIFACHGLIVPTAMMLSLENHGTIAGMAAALGGTLQMLLGTISIIIMSMVFDGRPLALVITLLVCALLAFAISAAIARSIRMATDA